MIFHKHQLVFIAIPKTASTSIWWLLRNRTDGFEGHQHYSILDVYEKNDKDLVDFYYSFAVVRNPYTRFISAFKHMKKNRNLGSGIETPLDKLKDLYKKMQLSENKILERHMDDDVWIPQNQWCCIHKIPVVDKIMRYETLEEEWNKFVEFQNARIPISHISDELPKHNVGDDSEIILGDEEKKYIQKIYRNDFTIFGYSI